MNHPLTHNEITSAPGNLYHCAFAQLCTRLSDGNYVATLLLLEDLVDAAVLTRQMLYASRAEEV